VPGDAPVTDLSGLSLTSPDAELHELSDHVLLRPIAQLGWARRSSFPLISILITFKTKTLRRS